MSEKYYKVGEGLSEQFRSLKEHRAVIDWWQKRETQILYAYQGVSHTLNLALAENQKQQKQIQDLKEEVEAVKLEREESNALIGQLQSDLQVLSERLERIASWVNKQAGRQA